jgi:hypothetical protein
MVPMNIFNYKSEWSNYSYTSKCYSSTYRRNRGNPRKISARSTWTIVECGFPSNLKQGGYTTTLRMIDWLIDDYQGDLWPWWWEYIVRVSKVTILLNRSWEIVKFLYEWSPQAEKWFLLLQAAGLCKWNATHLLPVYRQFIVTKTELDFLTPVWSNGKQWAHFAGQLNHS